MKTNFPLRSKRHVRSRRREVIFVGLVFLLCVVGFTLLGKPLSNAFGPLWRSNIFIHTGITNVYQSLRDKDALISENAALKERLAADDELIVSLRAIASSRDDLLEKFGRLPPGSTPASVLVHPPETPYDTLVVDAGENAGVHAGSLVTTAQGVAIGTVSFVSSRTSQVKLYSTAGERTDAVLERGNESVTLVGRGGGVVSFTLPRDVQVEVGDRILLPVLDTALVAVVGDIEITPTDSEKTVLARSPSNTLTERYVVIRQ